MLAVACALASSLMYALASVLQQREAAAQPESESLRVGLLVRLARNPVWVAGLGADVLGFVLQFIALGHGPLVVVQPLLVCGLLFALPIGAAWAGRKLHATDWMGAVLVCAGLAVFLTVANPASGRNDVAGSVWALLLGSSGALAFVLVMLSLGRDARSRAVLLSASAGIIYGAAAALTKTSSHMLSNGITHLFTHWQVYVLILAGVSGMVIAQSAFQAGFLDVSLPTMTVLDPVVSIVIGAIAFGERIASGAAAVATEVVSLLAMTIGVFLLARVEAAKSDVVGSAASRPVGTT